MLYGIDVSHHQNPASLPWETFNDHSRFCIVRASYGTMADRQMVNHLAKARAVGMKVGCYHFFRSIQPLQAQLDVYLHQLKLAGMRGGDIVPTLDIELDPLPKDKPAHVSPEWQEPVRQFLSTLRDRFSNAMVYITQREYGLLGKPEWLLEYPLWVAHYTGAAKPATPANRPFTIWQHRVGPYVAFGPGGYVKDEPFLDQNRAEDLPLISAVNAVTVPQPATTDDDDSELEDLILQHNQALLDDFVTSEYAALQERLGRGGEALREYERAAEAEESEDK